MKKLTALMMSLLMLLLCAACAPKEQLTVNVAAMKGPTGIGMAQFSSLAEEGKTEYNYSITYAGSPDEVTGGLISGELDITAEWESVSDAQLVQGCLVVRKAFADEHPEALKAFLSEYAASAEYAVNSPAEAGALVEKYGIMASAALAEKAIPNCNIVCITGEEMQVMVSGMLKVLFDANPKSVGGKLPGDDMFYLG